MGARRTALLCSAGALAALALASMPGNGGAAPGAGPLQIKVGQAKDFSRVEFHWAGGAAVRSRRAGQTVVLNFSRAADPNLVDLRVHPPKWLKTAEARQTGGGLELTLTLADGADAKVGQADGATYVNLFEKKTPEPVPASVAVQTAPRVDPVPAGGVVRAAMEVRGPQVLVRFPWKAPLGAAVFRRGDAVWAVFDARAKLDLSALKTAPQITAAALVNGDGVSAVRFVSKDGQPINAWAEGPAWVIAIGPGVQEKPKPVSIGRDADAAEPAIAAAVAGATKIAWLADPVVGDRLAVVTAMAPSKGLGLRRDYVDFAVLSSANGLAIERAADDLKLNSDGDIVRIGRPGGLKISDAYARFDRKV
ncbi:MAG: endoglucanase, partial [Caulobacteraceae bacterium]